MLINKNADINIQNESESNWNLRTKSEAFRPSFAPSIDPEKMNIRGYLDNNRQSSSSSLDSPIMDIVDRLLTSKVINLLIEVPMRSHRIPIAKRKLAEVLTQLKR